VLLLTHAHLDHCGRIPLLVKRGFRGEIVCTAATRDLSRLVLLDSAHLHEEEATAAQPAPPRPGRKDREPLYDTVDALDSLDRFGREAEYGRPVILWDGRARHVPRCGPHPRLGQHPLGAWKRTGATGASSSRAISAPRTGRC
jgi:Cft2 family RNA processing exonuclease